MAVIGIDLGTTNSAAGYFDGTSPVVLPSERADGLLPSVVMYHKGGFLVGEPALEFAHKDPANAIFSIKRLMGRTCDEPKVEEVRPRVNYSIVRASSSDDPGVRVLLGGQEYTPVQISTMILSQIKSMAEKKLGQPVTHAVITVPAYFEERQRAATREAGRRAGFIVKRIIDEPSAAAIAYGFTVSKGMRKRILAFDLGGGTFDVSIIHTVMSQDGVNHFEVVEKRGDNWLGGDDFDRAIVAEMVAQVKSEYGFDPSPDKGFQLLAKQSAEKAKIALSTSERTAITLPAAYAAKTPDGRIIDLDMLLTRPRLDEIIRPYVDRCMKHVIEALRYQGMEPDDIDVVLMVGGSTLVPLVHEAVTGLFGQEKVKQVTNPFHSVALGAGILAATLRGVQCPKCQKENDEAEQYCRFCRESLSAAVSVGGISIGDVTAVAFGIKAVRGEQPDAFEVIIPKGEPFPLRHPKSRQFETTSDNFIQIPVYEGVEPVASKNEEQGVIEISPSDFAQADENAPAGTMVTVSMNYDQDRVTFVKVQVHGTNVEREFRLRHDRPRQGARRAAADARKWKDELEFWLRVAERLRDKYQTYMEPRHRSRLEADLQRANQALGTEDASAIQDACKALGITVHSCGVASTLFLAEEVQTGASPERSRRMNETVQRIKEAWAEGRKDQATELMEALRTAIAAEVRRQSRELPGQRDFGGLLRVRDY